MMIRMLRPFSYRKTLYCFHNCSKISSRKYTSTSSQDQPKDNPKNPIKLTYLLDKTQQEKGKKSSFYQLFGYIFLIVFGGSLYAWHRLQYNSDFHTDGTEGIPLQTLTTRLIATPGKLREWLKQKFRKPRPVAEYLDEE